MVSLGDILADKIKAYQLNPQQAEKTKSKEYQKRWSDGVQHFQIVINKERAKVGMKPLPFLVIRGKLVALKEIEDLRWFYYHCIKYSKTKDKNGNWNTFSKCFWGALDPKKCK